MPPNFILRLFLIHMIIFRFISIFYLLFSLFSVAHGQNLTALPELLSQAKNANLAENEMWYKLLHYKKSNSRYESEVVSKDFFFSSTGRTDPQSELTATLTAMLRPPSDINTHAQCRFPARYKWLKKELSLSDETAIGTEMCPDYVKWTLDEKIDGISLIFASGHLSNPASFYGHILLKFNTENTSNELNLLDTSLNYGAIMPENENALLYIFRGLFGGYDGSYTNQQFYRHNHKYAENELRDLWNYELNLSKEQVSGIVDHSWELLGAKFTYYFLKQNCGYKMAELLNLVIDHPLLPSFKEWAMPSDTLSQLVEANNNGKKLVKDITLIKSRQNEFRDKFKLLTLAEKSIAVDFINQKKGEAPSILSLEPASNKRVIDTLFDYYAFILTKEDADIKTIEARRRTLLLSRLKLDTKELNWPKSDPAPPPHKSQKSSMVQASYIYNDKLGSGALIRFRPAYYDFLSLNRGRAPYTQMSMMDLSAVIRNNKISLKHLDLLKIETLNISPTGLSEDGNFAWNVGAGIREQNLNCLGCLHGYLSGGIGKAYSIDDKLAVYLMATGELVGFGKEGIQVKTGVKMGLVSNFNDYWQTHLETGVRESITSGHKLQKFVSWENRFGNSTIWDTRLKFTYHDAAEITFGAGFYW